MKHLFKKGLSLLLAVLMVTSMLPMSTLAAAITDSRTAGESGVYSNREDADPPETELPDGTGEDLTEAPADIADGADDLRVELPADSEPVADGEEDLRVELPTDMEPADGEEDLRSEIPAGEDQSGERPEKPDIGEEPDEPAKPLWYMSGITLDVDDNGDWTITMDLGDVSITNGTAASGAWAVAIIPDVYKDDGDHMSLADAESEGRFNTGTSDPEGTLGSIVNGITGLEEGTQFIWVLGDAPLDIDIPANNPDKKGTITIDSSTPGYAAMPLAADLRTALADTNLGGGQIYLRALVLVKGVSESAEDNRSMFLLSEAYSYVEVEPEGIPSTVYSLNKATNTLTFLSGSLGGRPWNPTGIANGDEVSGWNTPRNLTIPIYNETGADATVDVDAAKAGLTAPNNASLNNIGGASSGTATIGGGETANAAFIVNASEGTIVLPISAVDNNGDPLSPATITIIIGDAIPVTADPIVFDIDMGTAFVAPAKKPVTFHWPSTWLGTYESEDEDTGEMVTAQILLGEEEPYYIDIYPDEDGSYPSIVDPSYSLSVDYQESYIEDIEMNGVVINEGTPISIEMSVYDSAFNAPKTLTTAAKIVDAYERWYGVPVAEIEIPITINVHAGYAKFIGADGKEKTTVTGAPSKAVAAANTVGGAGIPTGKWASSAANAAAGIVLTDSQIILGGRDATRTYYEIMEAATYNVTYHLGTGEGWASGGSANKNDATGVTSHTVVTEKPTKTNHRFDGWATTSGGAKVYDGGESVTLTADLDLYPVWVEQTTITYNVNYPTRTGTNASLAPNAPGANTGDKGRTIDTTATALQLADTAQYTFGGWYEETGCTTAAGATYAANASATLYAKWTPIEHQVTYAAGAASGVTGLPSPNPVTGILHGTSHTISTTEPTRSGYTFAGWTSDVSGDTKTYKTGTANNAITVNDDITLTAQWSLDDTTVTFDPKDGSTVTTRTGQPSTDATPPTGYTAGTTVKTISGKSYKFAGWSTSDVSVGTGATTTTTFKFPTSGTQPYYGVWTEQTTITYNVNYPTRTGTNASLAPNAPGANTGDKGRTIDTTATALQLADTAQYTFGGWYEETGCTTAAGATYAANANATLYAKWTPIEHQVTYAAGATSGVTGLPSTNPVTGILHGTSHTISTTEPTRSGYTFAGWTSDVSGDTKTYKTGTANNAITVNDDITLTAQWSAIINTVKYTDPASSGATMPGNATITAGAVTLSAPTSVPTGWTFVNWKVQGDTTTYTGTQALTGIVGDLTLEAQWKVDVTYVSTYGTKPANLTGTTAVPYNTNITVGAITAASGEGFTSNIYTTAAGPSYRFTGWTASPAANISSTTVGATNATVTGPVTLTAGWVGQSSVKFDLNGGTLTAGKTVPGDQSGDVSTAIPTKPTATAAGDVTKTGYTFAGWAKNKNNGTASDAVTVANIQFPATAGATDTYYAIWTINTYTVTFKRNYNTSDTTTHDTKTTNYNTALGSSNYPANPSRTGYTFGGWYPNNDGTGTEFTNATPVTGNTTVYAKWTPNTYNVVYAVGKFTDGQIKSGETPQVVTYDDATCVVKAGTGTGGIVEAQAGKSMTGWNFQSWNTAAAGTGTTYNPGDDLSKITAGMTLTAQWTVDVTFLANIPTGEDTATGNPNSVADPGVKTAPAGKAVASFPTNLAALKNYTFNGWNTKADGSGTAVTSATVFDAPATVYAQWEPRQYTVSFVDNDENSGNPSDVKNVYGHPFDLPSAGSKTGYTTTGWYDKDQADAATATRVGDAGDTYTITKDETLYAHWAPVDVTIVYQTDVGTAPGSDTKKYNATDYTAKNKNTVKNTAGAGWNAGETIFTDDSGNRWQFNGWDILKADNSVLKRVASGAAINPVNTTNGVVKQADGTYTLTLKANWTQLFTITYNAGAHGTITTQPTSHINVPAGPYNAAYPSSGATLAQITGGTWETANGIFTIGNDHWQFDGWSGSDGKSYNANARIDLSSDLTLTAKWQTRYKITLAEAKRPDGTTSAGHVGANVGTTLYSNSSTQNSTYVSGAFNITNLARVDTTTSGNYIFVRWIATDTGAFTNGEAGNTNQSTNANDTFTPTADTTLTPVYALKPTLSPAVDGYQLNFATDANVGANTTERQQKWQYPTTSFTKPTNSLPTYTWTAGDATMGTVTITAPTGTTLPGGGTTATLTAGTDYTNTDGVIQFQRAYLLKLETTRSYTVTVNATTNGTATNLTATLWAVTTPDPLTKVDIGVKPDTAASYEPPLSTVTPEASRTKTASVTDTTRNEVKYLDHAATSINPNNLLTYQWYYADAPVTNRGPAQTLAALPALPTGATKIGNSTTTNKVAMDNDVYKGKYIFATVVATGTGKDAVVTNSIPVDYDAVIQVTKDGSASITGGNYTVYLLEQPSTGSNDASYASMPATAVATTNTAGTNQYATAVSALTGGKTYDIYVNKVEGNTTLFVKTNLTVKTQTNANAAPEVKFFSVNAVDTALKHAKDSNSVDVGESFGTGNADAPATEFYAEGVTAKFNSGMGVFTGTKVTAKASKTWAQDYDVNWGMKEDAAATAPALTYTTDNQTAANATATGKDYANIDAKTWIGAQLEQNTYTVTGNVWVNGYTNGSNAGIVASGSVPTLKYTNGTTTYVFNATVNNNGVHKSTVTFTGVPRSGVAGAAIAGPYVVEATAKSSNTKSTIIKYIPGQNMATASDTSVANVNALTNQTLAADIPAGGVTAPQFTVVLAASTYILKAADTETPSKSAQHENSSTTDPGVAVSTSGGRYAAQAWTGTFAGITAKTYTINVTNEGNMALDVKLNIKRTMGGSDVYVYGDKKAGSDDLTVSGSTWTDSDNNVTFGTLQDSFTLARKGETGDSVTFTVTIPTDLTVNNAADYAFELTSMEKDSTTLYGPSVTYKLTQTVEPLKIDTIGYATATGGYTATGLVIKNNAGTTVTLSAVQQSAEVEYKWYVTANGVTPTLTKTGAGSLSTNATLAAGNQADGTYQTATGDQGKALWVVAHNKTTGNVIEAAMAKVADLPYDLKIQVNEDANPTASKGNYTVYLWATDGGTFNAATAIAATATADADGRYLATGLEPGKTYDVYTNAVGGAHSNYQKSGTQAKLSDFTGNNVPVVTYRSVTINNTTTDNSPYSFANSSSAFIKDADGSTTVLDATTDGAAQKPTATLKADTSVTVATTNANKWVQQGTVITATYPAWNKDYDLTWDVGAKVTDETTAATGDVTVSASKTINSKLTLNTYAVTLVVDGPGTLSEVKMNDGTNDFTASAGSFHATGSTTPPIGKGSYTFTVPKGTYTVEGTGGTGTDILYYKIPASSTTEIFPGNIGTQTMTVADNTSSFHIQLNSIGQYMLVEDDQTPVDNTTITAHSAGTAGWTGSAKTDSTAGSTIHLPYGYTAARTVAVTVANNSAENNHLYDVTWTPAASGNSASITAVYADLDGSNNIMYPYGGTADAPLTATLTVATGLAVGTHTYTADVTFNTADGDATHQPKVTYTLTVVVDPTKFTAVTVSGQDGSGKVALGDDLSFDTYTTETVDDWTNGKKLTAAEYTYQWYHGPANTTATESWDAGTATVTGADAISGATGATLAASEIAKYPGERIYLVISAVNNTNVIEAAISAPVTTGFQPVVKVSVDGTDQSTVAGFDGTDYTATIDDGTTTWNTVWSAAKGGFVPVDGGKEVSLDATKSYTAKVSRAKGDSTNLVALDDKLSNTTTANTVTAPYFTVNAVETKAFEGITGLGEDFDGADKLTGPAVSFTLGGAALADGTPVLSGQSVKANTAGWTQDYELTWYTRMDGAAVVPARDNAYEGTPTMTAQGGKVDSASATTTGYTVNSVTNKLYVGARLDQIQYTVIGTVSGTGSVSKVALDMTDPKTAAYIYPDTTTPATSPVKPTSSATGDLKNGDTVTFTVVKSTINITPTEGSNTVIKQVSWEGAPEADGVTTLTGKEVKLKAADPKRTYNFVITVEGADVKLKVSDDAATATSAESNPNAWNDAKNAVDRYFNYIRFKKADSATPDTYEYVLTLTNGGNKELKVNAEVYHFATAPATGFGADATKWNTTKANGTLVYATADGATATLAGASTKTVLSLSEMMSADTVVAAKDPATSAVGTAKAGKITLGEDAWSKDTGAYVFHFMGVTNDADATKVDVYYVLDLTVNQLPIVKVETNNSGAMVGVGETITAKGYDADDNKSLANVMVKTSDKPDQTNAAAAKLTGDDVHFAWVKVNAGATAPVKANLSVNTDGTLKSTVGTVVSQSETYTLVAGDQDKDFYLVAFAPNYTGNVTNATDMAISAVVKAKRTVGVKVTLDTYPDTTGDYDIYLVESGKALNTATANTGADGTWATTWNSTSNRYEAPVDVDNKTYEVYAVTYKGGTTVIKAIDGTLGGTTTEQTVPYFSVKFTENVAVDNTRDGFKSYLPGGAATTDNAIQKALSVAVSTTKGATGTTYETTPLTASDAGTPVLSGMNVKVTVDATKASKNTTSGVKTSWSETDVQPLHTLTTTGWADAANKTSGIAYAASIASGDIAVTSAKTFSAQLKQTLFTVKFTVKDVSTDENGDPSPSTKTALQIVTLTPRGEGAGATYRPQVNSGNSGYYHNAVVTISGVPMGDYTVNATKFPGSSTLVTGYTWNDANTEDKEGDIVEVSADTAKNEDTTGNTIRMLEATKVVNWFDTFDDATGGVLADGAFNPSNGFAKVDDTASPKKLFGLTEGYSAAKGDVLTYTVRAMNGGTDTMRNFYLAPAGDDLIYDLTDVRHCKLEDDGTVSEIAEHLDATTKFDLGANEFLEFTVTIPEGKKGDKDYYAIKIIPDCDKDQGEADDLVTKQSYDPKYQVKTPVEFKPGEALVFYGGSSFESNTDIALDWPTTTDETAPTFTYEILELDGANDAAILAEINSALGLGLTTLDEKPAWLTANVNTGAITIPTGAHADTVNVQLKDPLNPPKDFKEYDIDANGHKVKGEITLYIKATDNATDETYIIPYVVDVEPGQLKIQNPSFTYTTDDTVGGQSLDKSKFTYTKVINQAAAPLDVIPATAITGDNNTAEGNNTPKDGKVYVNDGTDDVHTATWTVTPDKYVSDVSTPYAFTVTYKPLNNEEKWNYKPDTYVETITASKPKMDLLFSDVLGKAEDEPADAELKLGRAPEDGYSEIATDDNQPYAPAAMEQTKNTYRLGEYIVYLDTEPKYVVTLHGIGDIYNVEVEAKLDGFRVVDGDLSFTNNEIHDTDRTFTLELAPMSGTTNQWAGTHTAEYTVTGNSKADGTGDSVEATYKLSITVKPKVIAEAHVTGPTQPAPGVKPSTTITVTAKDPEGEDIKPGTPDKHGNTPITPDVKWTEGGKPVDPTKDFEDGKDYTVTIKLPADPNYTFVDKDPADDPEPNYTKDGKTDANDDPAKVDESLTVTVTPDPDETKQNKEVKLEKTIPLPKKSHLEFEDVNADNANDKVDHSVEATRSITVIRGDKLGKYNISLGAWEEAVTDVTVAQKDNTSLPTGTVWSLEPADVGTLAKDGKQTYVLDLTGVDTTKNTGAYTLALEATGFDPYGTRVTATYTLTIQVAKAAPPTLMFDDVKQAVAGVVTTDPATTGPKNEDERTINTIVGGKLGKYTIYLGSYNAASYDVTVKATPSANLADVAGIYQLGRDCDTLGAVTLTSCGTVANAAGADKTKAQAFELDLTGMSVNKTGTYTLLLEAEGKDINDDDVTATYTLIIQVAKAPAGELRFDDVKTGGDTKDPDALGPDKDLKRLERLENPETPEQEYKPYEVVKGDALGTYTINLGAYGNTVNDVTVTETELKLPDGTVWALDPVSIATMTPGGDKTTYTLDLTGVDTAKANLGVYTLKLKAEGTDINGDRVEATYEIAIEVVKAPAPELKFDDVNADRPTDVTAPAVDAKRSISQSTNAKLGKYIINLGSYGGTTTDIKFTETLEGGFIGVYGVSPDCEALAPVTLTSVDLGGGKQAFELDLSGMDTKTSGTYILTLKARGVDINGDPVEATYTLTITLRAPGGGGGGSPACPNQVTYLLGLYGTTNDATMEMVSGSKVKAVPNVTALAGYKFLGWSLVGPTGDAAQDAKRALVDPKNMSITTDTVFYAVYQPVYDVPQPPIHKHYVIGYPNGNFGPADNIDRASVATIIARAVLPNFVEGADYGNPGAYTDVNGHWAASAIAYCSKYGVFNGYTDGTFKPNQPISRQELALVMARLSGVRTGGSVPFTDIGDAGSWAVDGIYTAYINGWVNGYTDGTFKPVNPIRRDETVKIFNAYLHRGVNAEGLEGLSEYVHSGVASNNTEDGTSQYMTWPDVTKDQWAYYEIIEAANDHEFAVDSTLPTGYAVPEQWTKCWIDEKWRYHDDANDGGPSAVEEALPNESGLDD